MKNLLKVAAVALCMVFMSSFAQAQTKIGYVAVDEVIKALPELKTVQTQLEALNKQWQETLNGLQTEFNTKATEFQAKQATMNEATKTLKQQELNDLQKRFADGQTTAGNTMEAKQNELTKPLIDKARTAVSAVAKEKGYTYIFNTSSTDLVVAPPADDLTAAVKAKLGLK